MPAATLDLVGAAPVFKALCDDTRLRVVELLADGERCVCDLQAELDIAQPLLSFHLRVLRDAGLVSDRRAGRWSYYSLRPDAFGAVEQLVAAARRCAETVSAARCCE